MLAPKLTYKTCSQVAQYSRSIYLHPLPTTLLVRSASHVKNHDAATLILTQAHRIDLSFGSGYDGSQLNLYEHDATYSNTSQ